MNILTTVAVVGSVGIVVAAYWAGYNAGTAEHEAAAQAAALKRAQAAVLEHKADLDTANRLTAQAQAAAEQADAAAQSRIEAIDRARAKAVREREHARKAHADAVQGHREAIDALAAKPGCPKPEVRCALDSTLPPLR